MTSEKPKVVFITGGAKGIGAATVDKFYREGYKVALFDADAEAGGALVSSLGRDNVKFYQGDVRRTDDLRAAIDNAVSTFGGLDVLFPNAGIHRSNTVLDISEDEWELMLAINLSGVMRTLKLGIPHLIAGGGGAVVLMSSDQAFIGKRNNFAYGVGKGAIAQMTRSLALEFADQGVRVNAVCPGTVQTPLSEDAVGRWADRDFGGDREKAWRLEAQDIPLGRVGQPQDIAEAIYFLSSDAAAHITGVLLPIDGGATAA